MNNKFNGFIAQGNMTNPIRTIEGEINTSRTDINPAEIPAGIEQLQNAPRVEQEPANGDANKPNIDRTSDNTVVNNSYAQLMRETPPDKPSLPNISSPWVNSIIHKAGNIKNISSGYGSENLPFAG